MDFAALMSKEISKAAPPSSSSPSSATTTTTATTATNTTTPAKPKYQRRADVEAERRAAYLAEQRALSAERESRATRKRKREDDSAEAARVREQKSRRIAAELRAQREAADREAERRRRKRLGLPELAAGAGRDDAADGGAGNDGDADGAEEEEEEEEEEVAAAVVAKLRGMGEPARLFGETRRGRARRLRRLGVVLTDGPIPTTLALVEEKEMKVGTVPQGRDEKRFLFRQLASYFTMVLREWETAVQREKRDTMASRAAVNAMLQSKENMRPLFRKFESGNIDNDVLIPIVEIVKAAQERRYVDANDGYLRLSIGKAAWPIGVTMVGIHERSAREKLHGADKGHVMGDEVTRKFLQSIKRCLSFAQVRWPPEDLRQLMG